MAIAQEVSRSAAPAAATDGEPLAARLREVVSASAVPIEALDPALRVILDATGAAAGAVCVYDQRQALLRLAAEAGLSDEGCRRLRTVRRGDVGSWDMPLHGLLNRRAYLIENAAQNRYVPPLTEGTATVRAVACLPMYAGSTPVGSLVLIFLAPATFRERDIQGLDRPLRELARLIETVRQQAADGSARSATGAAPPAPAPPAPAEAERLRSLTEELAQARAEGARFREELDRARADTGRDDATVAAEVERLRASLADAEARAAHAERTHAQLETDVDDLRRELARVREALEREREERAREAERRGAEHAEAIGAVAARADALAAEGERLRGALVGLEAERDRLGAEVEAAAAERVRLEKAVEDAEARARHVLDRLAERDHDFERLQALHGEEVASLAARVETLEAQGSELRCTIADLQTERDRLAAELESTAAAWPELETEEREPSGGLEHADSEPIPPQAEPDPPAPIQQLSPAAPVADTSASAAVRDGVVVVLDGDPGWERADVRGRIVVVAPERASAAEVVRLAPARILVNLAAAGTVDALALLRGAGCPAVAWGCLADPASDRALALGLVEPASRPLDPDAILAVLRERGTRSARVVTVAEDVEAFVSLRQALTRAGMSVAMAWNAKQAADLLPMVKPGVVVLDLDLAPSDASSVLVQLSALDPVPLAVLVPGGRSAATALRAALREPAAPRIATLAGVLARLLPGGDGEPRC